MSPLSSLSLVIQCKERYFLQKHSPSCFHTFRKTFAKFTTSLKLFIIFLCKQQMQRTKVVALFFLKGKYILEYQNFVCFWSDLNILEFPILMLLDSRQRLSNNLSDHFIDQILKMFIYLTLGRENLTRGITNKILQIK